MSTYKFNRSAHKKKGRDPDNEYLSGSFAAAKRVHNSEKRRHQPFGIYLLRRVPRDDDAMFASVLCAKGDRQIQDVGFRAALERDPAPMAAIDRSLIDTEGRKVPRCAKISVEFGGRQKPFDPRRIARGHVLH